MMRGQHGWRLTAAFTGGYTAEILNKSRRNDAETTGGAVWDGARRAESTQARGNSAAIPRHTSTCPV